MVALSLAPDCMSNRGFFQEQLRPKGCGDQLGHHAALISGTNCRPVAHSVVWKVPLLLPEVCALSVPIVMRVCPLEGGDVA